MSKIAKNTKVQIEFQTDSKRRIFLDCYVEVSEKDRLVMRFPPKGMDFLPYLLEGSSVKAFIYTYTGIWIINSIIIESPDKGQVTIEFKEEHQVIQRRKYFRIYYSTDLYLEIDGRTTKFRTADISGGGVRFHSNEAIKTGEQYNGSMRLSSSEEAIPMMGRMFKKDFSKPDEYVFEFTAIVEREREKIIQKCILIERERNKKY